MLSGVATNAITVLNLKQVECGPLVVTTIMEIFDVPTMKVTAVQKSRLHSLLPKKLVKE